MVASLLDSTKRLQDLLWYWSLGEVTKEDVGLEYVHLGSQFNATVTAFQYYNIDLRYV